MIIRLGSINPVKIQALQETITDYKFLDGAVIVAEQCSSGVSEQPKSLEETMMGACQRALKLYKDCSYSVGIESGVFELEHIYYKDNIPYMHYVMYDICACVFYDGRTFYNGLSSGWEVPMPVARGILTKGLDMDQAAYKAGLTDKARVGREEGLVGIMTNGRVTRKQYTKQAIQMALIHLEKNND